MINLIASLRKRLKAVSLSAWLVCVLVVLIGGWLIAVITKPPSTEQLQRNAEHEYYQRYNKFLPGEKTPEYDYKKYHMIKKDGRYFIIPRDYGTFNGVAFYWPSKTPYSLLKKGSAEDDGGNSQITVFIESKRFGSGHINLATMAKGAEACVPEKENNQVFLWNGLIVWFRFDDIHLADWPQICQEALRILDQVKEVKV
jgi:hypothetical protein